MRSQPSPINDPSASSESFAPPAWSEVWLAMLPELTMLGTVLFFAINGIGSYRIDMDLLMLALLADGATLLAFSSLIDVASRLKKPLPWWLALPIGTGILVLNGEVVDMLGFAWSQGLAVLIPFTWTLLDRIRQLWTLPPASDIEKIRRRTMTFDRLYVGIFTMVIWIVCVLIGVLSGLASIEDFTGSRALVVVGVSFYGIAAFNAWRVYQPTFSRLPRSLIPRLDKGNASSLDPL